MSKVAAIRERFQNADTNPEEFNWNAHADVGYLLSLLEALADEVVTPTPLPQTKGLRKASFDLAKVYVDSDGDPCLRLGKGGLN